MRAPPWNEPRPCRLSPHKPPQSSARRVISSGAGAGARLPSVITQRLVALLTGQPGSADGPPAARGPAASGCNASPARSRAAGELGSARSSLVRSGGGAGPGVARTRRAPLCAMTRTPRPRRDRMN